MTSDRHTAVARLRETEAALSRADNRRDAVGGYDTAAYHFHEGHVRSTGSREEVRFTGIEHLQFRAIAAVPEQHASPGETEHFSWPDGG